MRVPLKIALIAALLVVVTASGSWATVIQNYLPGGAAIEMKFVNYDEGTIYDTSSMTDGVTYTGAALAALPKVKAAYGNGDDTWGIFKLTSIVDLATTKNLWVDGQGNIEITGIFWGEQDMSAVLNGSTQTTKGVGLQYAFFEGSSTTNVFNSLLGPSARDDSSGKPVFATATDGTLIWTGTSLPGVAAASPYDFVSNYTPGNGIVGDDNQFDDGSGAFVGDLGTNAWGTGSLNWLLDTGSPDMRFTFKATNESNNGWLLRSDDPVRAYVTPELSSSALMLVGLLPIGMVWWRRKRG